MHKARGHAVYSSTSRFEPFSFSRRDLRDNDVRIDILYCGSVIRTCIPHAGTGTV